MTTQHALVNMIKQQLRTNDVLNEDILDLFESMPRQNFVPAAMQNFAYSDMQIPLAHGQRMLTPVEEGRLLQGLALKGNETVLEVGTGTGYFTALLSKKCKKVISVDYFDEFTKSARARLEQHGCTNVELITGDASQGWLDKAPYDAVVITGAVEHITESHRLQVMPGGKLAVIVGKEPIMLCKLLEQDHSGNWSESLLFETCVPALINRLKTKEFVF
ncbi:protein-L-isoaspartate O-methyltransferase [Legionella dresdenensis]|uniref:Protein-L-isoaspartate O-methyltransferase n=1 Tax=Legionella dresdenensis TaxID=450200 RepID=A0ABV8CHW2_9GAMM